MITLTSGQLAHIISTAVMCATDEPVEGPLYAAEWLKATVLAATQDVDLAEHAEQCIIACYDARRN